MASIGQLSACLSDTSSKNVHQGRICFNIRRLEKIRKLDMKQTKATAIITTTKTKKYKDPFKAKPN